MKGYRCKVLSVGIHAVACVIPSGVVYTVLCRVYCIKELSTEHTKKETVKCMTKTLSYLLVMDYSQ